MAVRLICLVATLPWSLVSEMAVMTASKASPSVSVLVPLPDVSFPMKQKTVSPLRSALMSSC